MDFINDYTNDEDEGTFESPPSNNRRGGIDRAEKEGGFNEALGFVFETSIQSLGEKRGVWHGLFMIPMRKMERRLT